MVVGDFLASTAASRIFRYSCSFIIAGYSALISLATFSLTFSRRLARHYQTTPATRPQARECPLPSAAGCTRPVTPVDIEGDFYTVEEAAKVLERTPGRIRQMLRDETLEGEGGSDPKDPWRYTNGPSTPRETKHPAPPA
jgi:hypothetical protein